MGEPQDHRRSFRIKCSLEALYSSGRLEGSGVLADISYSGALVAENSLLPPIGSKVQLLVLLEDEAPFRIAGRVVRHAHEAFAIEYSQVSADLRRLVRRGRQDCKEPLESDVKSSFGTLKD